MKKKFYITTAIDYVNARPHIGHALEKVQADVLARYHRLKGDDVFFLTGTDENAQKNVLAAEKAGVPVLEFVSENADFFKDLVKSLDISNDAFIQTAIDKQKHWPGVAKLWNDCQKTGDIYKKDYQGFYCVGCEAFLTEKDLTKDGLCPEHLKAPEKIVEENYFFRLSKYQGQLEKLIASDKLKIVPENRKNEVLSFIRSGLEDFSVSRPAERMKGWGVPVPGDETQIIYVWLDALSNYITALGYGGENNSLFKKYWPADVHAIGKGIVRFHAVFWPAMLLSAGIKLPKAIFVHEYITVDGQKMSKSLGNVIDPLGLVEKYGSDPVRYFFLREISPFHDGDFSRERFEQRFNAGLANGLGNLTSRILTLAEKSFGGEEIKCKPDSEFKFLFQRIEKDLDAKMEEFKLNEALSVIWELIASCDQYVDKERPWEKEDNEQILKNLLAALFQIALLLRPFLPETAEKVFVQLGSDQKDKIQRFKIKKSEALFPRLE